ncbi:MAG: GGDEF domain-containing protein [Synergistaceae bacterium]|nr:GGDEF domain-containing protein [Synergistaceae bacterium]
MKGFFRRKESAIIFAAFLIFGVSGMLSITSIRKLHGNARVVNYVGIVRGGTQMLVKRELMGVQDDDLVNRLDEIVNDLLEGGGVNSLAVLDDDDYMKNMERVRESWIELKAEIERARASGDSEDSKMLFRQSEDYFDLVNETVFFAETYSERSVTKSMRWLIGTDVAFVLLILLSLAWHSRSVALKRRADALGRIAYLDSLTQMPNRTSCEREIADISMSCPDGNIAVIMFDMNNLKLVNDVMGHQGGDKIIAEFGRILNEEGKNFGFVGRYGGDEFLAIFRDSDDVAAGLFLALIDERVDTRNLVAESDIEKIYFAAGCFVGDLANMDVTEMINEADRRMYEKKRFMKEGSAVRSAADRASRAPNQ